MSNATTSTGERPFSGSGTGRQHSQDNSPPPQINSESWFKKPEVIIAIMGMVITGIIGFSSAYTLLKDDINQNKTGISVINEKNVHYDDRIKQLSTDIKKIPTIERNLAVIQEKVITNRQNINSNREMYNKSINGDR